MDLSLRHVGLLVFWTAALYGTLQIHHVSDYFGHAICGAWGCGPPVAALAGYHLFWIVLLLPLAEFARRRLPASTSHRVGQALLLIAGLGIVLLVLLDGIEYFRQVQEERYIWQRAFFRVATFVELPLVPLSLSGLLLLHKERYNSDHPVSSSGNTPL